MTSDLLFLILLIYTNVLADFVLQPDKWAQDKRNRKFKSKYLYLHVLIVALLTGVASLLFVELNTAAAIFAIIFVSHLMIDSITARYGESASALIIDQGAHLAVILSIWAFLFNPDVSHILNYLTYPTLTHISILLLGYTVVLHPSGIIISRITRGWRDSIYGTTATNKVLSFDGESLENAGKYIGYMERFLILTFILLQQYTAIGFLIAAKSILRFNASRKTSEYILIGTLLSFSIAILVGFVIVFASDNVGNW